MSEILCSIRDLGVRFTDGGQALSGIDLDIAAGRKLAIIGESGSGKSTLARSIAGLLPDNARISGTISRPGRLPVPGRDIGFVFQDPGSSLNPVLTVGEQIAEGARHHLGLSWRAATDRAADLLERVGLSPGRAFLSAFPHQLSGGQRQRVAIAAAIAAQPRILIADEVTSALDTVAQAEIARLLTSLVAADGMTLLFITHDIALASGLADRIAVLDSGRLVEEGAAAQVLGAPKSEMTRRLLAAHRDLSTPPLVGAFSP